MPELSKWDLRFLKALDTTRAKAGTLGADGYKMDPMERSGLFAVTTPERKTKALGGHTKCYEVDLANWTCECEMFQYAEQKGARECKHILWVYGVVMEAVRIASNMIPGAVVPEAYKKAEAQRRQIDVKAREEAAAQRAARRTALRQAEPQKTPAAVAKPAPEVIDPNAPPELREFRERAARIRGTFAVSADSDVVGVIPDAASDNKVEMAARLKAPVPSQLTKPWPERGTPEWDEQVKQDFG